MSNTLSMAKDQHQTLEAYYCICLCVIYRDFLLGKIHLETERTSSPRGIWESFCVESRECALTEHEIRIEQSNGLHKKQKKIIIN